MTIVKDLAAIKDEVKGISKVLWIDDPVRIKKLSTEIRNHFGDNLKCVSSMSHFLEFVSKIAGKGIALAEICKLYDIDKSEIIAVGDNYNDVCMLEYAGLSVAVENAPDDIKAICDHITKSNNNDGVAEIIERFIL
jgi:Cof subfamily protein (haloacid dehalogenase superfamily)